MGSSEFLIVVCSPRSAKSQWVNREVAWFKTHRDPANILTVIVDGEPMASLTPGREAEECFPKTLLYKVDADLQPTAAMEDAPLAADARETGDGRRGAKLKLASAMLGVGFDALQRRDDRRRAQRRRIVMGAMAALIALLGGLTIFAFNQSNAAIAARNEAVVARNDARFQRDEAQSLVEFMLTDLRQRLDAVGRLDILDAVAERLNESYAQQDLTKLDADALGRRARVQLLLGEVDNTRGNLDAALAQYKEAAATTEELLKRNPGKAQQIFDHAQSVFWVGYIAWQRGDAAEAKKYFTQYKDYADELVTLEPENEDWRMEVVYANSNLGTLAMDEGDAAEAVGYFKKSLSVSIAMAEAQPTDNGRLIELSQSYSWLALAQERIGAFADAEAALLAEKAVIDAIKERDAGNSEADVKAQVNARGRARVALASGDSATAISLLRKLAARQESLAADDPQNTNRQQYYAWSLVDLGEAQLAIGAIAESAKTSALANEASNRLVAIDPSVVEWRISAAGAAHRLAATIKIAEGDYARALAIIDEVGQTISDDAEEKQVDRDLSALRGSLATIKARAFTRLGDQVNARKSAEEAVAILEPANVLFDPSIARRLVEAYIVADMADKATEMSHRLVELGYRHPEFTMLLDAHPAIKAAAEATAAHVSAN